MSVFMLWVCHTDTFIWLRDKKRPLSWLVWLSRVCCLLHVVVTSACDTRLYSLQCRMHSHTSHTLHTIASHDTIFTLAGACVASRLTPVAAAHSVSKIPLALHNKCSNRRWHYHNYFLHCSMNSHTFYTVHTVACPRSYTQFHTTLA